jgi:hypothetical protein
MSKPVDRYGEPIRKGILMHWGKLDQPVEVTDIEAGGLLDRTEGAPKGALTPGFVTVQFKLPFGQDGKGADTVSVFKDFMVLMRGVDGPSDKVLDDLERKVEHGRVQQIRS